MVAVTDSATRPRRRLGAEERRAQLVAATVQVLAAHGFRGTTAEAIVSRARVSKGLLWQYFTDLDDLLEHTARHTLAALAQTVGGRIDLTAPAPAVVRAAIAQAAGILTTHPAERTALNEIVSNLRTADGALRLSLQDYEDLYAAQEAIFRRGQDDGDIRADLDPRVLAVTYQGAVDAMLGYLEEHPEIDADRYASTVADILLDGCRVR